MNSMFLLVPILLSLSGCILIPVWGRKGTTTVYRIVFVLTALISVVTFVLIFTCSEAPFKALSLTSDLSLVFRFDRPGRYFAGLIAFLWPFTVLYASEYMKDDPRPVPFYTFFMLAYGITLGIAMAGNLFTLYVFYELLTLSTVPLVMHPMTRSAIRAAATYFAFSLGGAAFVFACMMYLIGNGFSGLFTPGGIISALPGGNDKLLLLFFFLGFLGFSVKAALFPMHHWLPKASVAPTPVTALLHAVAVVKAGAFAVIRLIYSVFGCDLLAGSWAQQAALVLTIVTILYGSSMALKEQHWKRRLAYSTVANLSYILFGVLLMTETGLSAALLHMIFHAQIKILAFFCAGAVLHSSGRQYLSELNGIGKAMPVTLGCFTIASLGLTGIPPFSGFISKWHLLMAAAQSSTPLAYAGAAVLLISALLTAMYMFSVLCRAWFPVRSSLTDSDPANMKAVHEVNGRMTIPMILLALCVLLTGLFASPFVRIAGETAAMLLGG